MKLSTEVKLPVSNRLLGENDKVVFLGSCFAENIGRQYPSTRGEALVNPLGIAFNPFSLLAHLKGEIHPDLFFQKGDDMVHFQYHSALKSATIENLRSVIQETHRSLVDAIKNATCIFISYGTAWHYVLNQYSIVVCNNHKADINLFEKRVFSNAQLQEIIRETTRFLRSLNSDIDIVFTVSPVKHIRDGLVENSRGKANLLSAVHDVCENYAFTSYFPSYEIVNDELRDYRYYSSDMAHPSELAQEFIFDKVKSTYFSKQLIDKSKMYQKLLGMQAHATNHLSEKQLNEWHNKLACELEKFNNRWY